LLRRASAVGDPPSLLRAAADACRRLRVAGKFSPCRTRAAGWLHGDPMGRADSGFGSTAGAILGNCTRPARRLLRFRAHRVLKGSLGKNDENEQKKTHFRGKWAACEAKSFDATSRGTTRAAVAAAHRRAKLNGGKVFQGSIGMTVMRLEGYTACSKKKCANAAGALHRPHNFPPSLC